MSTGSAQRSRLGGRGRARADKRTEPDGLVRGPRNAGVLRGEFDSTATPDRLRAAYEARLAATVRDQGLDRVVEATDVDRGGLAALASGEPPELTVAEAAAILGTDPDRPDGATLAAEARDLLLVELTAAVVDVEELSASLDRSVDPDRLRAKLEGREPLALGTYAAIHGYVGGRG